MKIYQVGGAVRDKILQKTPNDVDYVVVGSNINQIKNLTKLFEIGNMAT